MTETPDLDALARQYLDLWQQHLSELAGDGETADAIAKSIELMNGSAAAFARMAENASLQPREQPHGDTTEHPSGAQAPGPAPEPSDDVLDRLSRRIGELEKRIHVLESASGGKGKGPKRKA